MLKRIILSSVKTGAVLSVVTAATIMLFSKHETGKSWAAINAISHIVDGDDVTQPNNFETQSSLTGLAVNSIAMASWAILFETFLAFRRRNPHIGDATVATIFAYIIDYHIVPARFSPGIEKKLSLNSVIKTYIVLAITLSLTQLWNDYDHKK